MITLHGIKIRSKYEWYEYMEKSTNFFLNILKTRGVQNRIQKLIIEEKEKTDHKEISINVETFYQTLSS